MTIIFSVFKIWLGLLFFVLFISAIYEKNLLGLLNLFAIVAFGLLFLVFWKNKETLRNKLKPRNNITNFLLYGWITGMVAELFLYYTLSYENNIPLFLTIIYTTPTYIGLLVAWWYVSQRFSFSNLEIFFLGGLLGWVIELPNKIFSGQSITNIIFGTPGHIFIYGLILLVPFTLLNRKSEKTEFTLEKALFSLFIPPLIVLPFFVFSLIILLTFKN